MSWPSDGQPRFKLVVERPAPKSPADAFTYTILDRAICHRVVRSWQAKDRLRIARERMLLEAQGFLDDLNARADAFNPEA